jgi:Ion channel
MTQFVRLPSLMDMKKSVMIRMRVALALGVVGGSIAIGSVMAHFLEGLNWIDSLYLSVTSMTAVDYGYSAILNNGRKIVCFSLALC